MIWTDQSAGYYRPYRSSGYYRDSGTRFGNVPVPTLDRTLPPGVALPTLMPRMSKTTFYAGRTALGGQVQRVLCLPVNTV